LEVSQGLAVVFNLQELTKSAHQERAQSVQGHRHTAMSQQGYGTQTALKGKIAVDKDYRAA